MRLSSELKDLLDRVLEVKQVGTAHSLQPVPPTSANRPPPCPSVVQR